ncbi:glycosyltransferase family 4 protein [Flavobacterium panacagri]|uniref:glycosyltransferase family 4 protein n=1 Tax=Flavobacterium panacagri TaxID=3034146 RepID=UPI0025A5E48E|nr:glycosyltransferase family 4 protein [Flavobacterium panacagri]
MHIAFLTPEFPHAKTTNSGGLGTSIKNLVESLVKADIQVTVFVYGQKNHEIIKESNLEIHLIKNKKYKFFGWFFHRKHIEQYCNSIIKKKGIDLIEAPDWTGITAFMKFKIPLVIRFHGSDTYFCHLENRKQKIKNFWFEKLATKGAKAFIAPTSFAGEVSKKLFKIEHKEIATIHYGLSLSNFENDNPKEFEKNLILYIGTIIRKKGVLALPEIFNKVRIEVPDAKLVLIGVDSFDIKTNSNSTWELMKDLFNQQDLKQVDYLGKIPYEEVQKYIRKANICVFPTFAETLGMVTIESMAMQKAVVNSNIGWAQELIVDQESGFLVHPSNHDDFSNRIIQLLQSDLLCQEIGKKARTRVEAKFDINTLVHENIEFYKKIINPNKSQ